MNPAGAFSDFDQNTNPQTTTGHAKLNVVVDPLEWARRAPKLGSIDIREVAKVGQRELVFARRGAAPASAHNSLTLSHSQVFVAFNGVLPGEEKNYKFIGVSCGPAEHQDTNPQGPLSGVAQFALWQGGTNTILTVARVDIPKLAKLSWRIPTGPVVVDPLGKGRILAEIIEYDPRAYFDVRDIHAKLSNLRLARKQSSSASGLLMARVDEQLAKDSQFAFQLWEKLKSIAYTMYIAFVESAVGGSKLSDAQKLEAAGVFGLIKVTAQNQVNRALAFEQAALDSVFQMKNDGNRSMISAGLTAFPPVHIDIEGRDDRQTQIANLQSGQVQSLLFAVVDVFNRSQEDIIGYTTTGGRPNQPMDVVLYGQ